MNNLLPQSRYGGSNDPPLAAALKASHWVPEESVASSQNNRIPFGLEREFTKAPEEKSYLVSVPAQAEPNFRENKAAYKGGDEDPDDVSPLCSSERGVAEAGRIAMPKSDDYPSSSSSHSSGGKEEKYVDLPLEVQVNNFLPVCMDLYLQRAQAIQSLVLRPNKQCNKCLTATAASAKENPSFSPSSSPSFPLALLLSTVSRVSVTITGRQEVRVFDFLPGPIGMEVEIQHNRLVCSRVLADSQAFLHESALDGAEIIAVNDVRVTTLEAFQDEVVAAQDFGLVSITASAYKKSRRKLDSAYANFFAKPKSTLKSMFSNIMSSVDADHQHDIALHKAALSDDEDEEEEEEEENQRPLSNTIDSEAQAKKIEALASPRPPSQLKEEGVTEEELRSQLNEEHYEEEHHQQDSESEDDEHHLSIRKGTNSVSNKKFNKKFADRPFYVADDSQEGMMIAAKANRDEKDISIEQEEDYSVLVTGEDEIVDAEAAESLHEEASLALSLDDSKSQEETEPWDYATALEMEEVVPFSTIVCVPSLFQCSKGWGNPNRYIQFTNYSTRWELQICWVDEESAIVPRKILHPGMKHMELTSPKHLWILIASLVEKEVKHWGSNQPREEEVPENVVQKETPESTPTVILLRPSAAALAPRKYTSIIWTPWKSLSAKQGVRAKAIPKHHLRPSAVGGPLDTSVVLPHLIMQLL